MKRQIIWISVILSVAHVFTELHSFVYAGWQWVEKWAIDLFLSRGFHMELPVLWYIKFSSDDLLSCIVFYLAARISLQYSRQLFYIWAVWFFYHMADVLLFWYNYKSSPQAYWILLAACILANCVLLWPLRKQGKYKSLV